MEGDLAVIAHHHVGYAEKGDHSLAPVRPIGGVGDVDVHLDAVVEPRRAVGGGALLEELRVRDRRSQIRLGSRNRRLLLLGALAFRQLDLRAERLFATIHPCQAWPCF
jgi:hypothetical protein